jgi:hypothetical protein
MLTNGHFWIGVLAGIFLTHFLHSRGHMGHGHH